MSETKTQDALLEALVLLAEHKGRHANRAALCAQLPLVAGRLTPELVPRAAARAGLEAQVMARALADITEPLLPAILLLQDNRACVLLAQDAECCTVRDAGGGAPQVLPRAVLAADYSGYCVYARLTDRVDPHVQAMHRQDAPHWFWSTLAQSWRIYRDVLLASVLINVFVLANPLFVMNVYDRVVPNNAIETLWALALGMFLLYAFDFVLRYLRTYFIEVAGKKSDVLLSTFIFERILGARYDAHPTSIGAFVSQVREFESVRNFITSASVSTLVDLPFVLLFLLATAYIGGPIVWVPLCAIPLILLFAWCVQFRLKNLIGQTFAASAQKNATLVEALSTLETVKALGAEQRLLHKWERAVALVAHWGLRWRIISASATTFSSSVQQIAAVVVVIVGVYAIAERELTQGALIASVILVGRALAPLAQLSGLLVQYHQSQQALQALDTLVHTPQEHNGDTRYVERDAVAGNIECRELSFTYPGEKFPAIKQCAFSIAAGERVAIVGRVGSGKSTLHKLLLGLYRPDAGAFFLDGIDIAQINPAELRRHIAYVPQQSALFYGTVRDNIAYSNPMLSDAEILRAAQISGAETLIQTHPHGLERVVGEGGHGLSGGQQQMLCLARAFAQDAPVMLLDEPTSAMDNATEAKILPRLSEALAGKTVLLVTHKTSLLALVDRVIVLDDGRVLADGDKTSVLDALQKGKIRVA